MNTAAAAAGHAMPMYWPAPFPCPTTMYHHYHYTHAHYHNEEVAYPRMQDSDPNQFKNRHSSSKHFSKHHQMNKHSKYASQTKACLRKQKTRKDNQRMSPPTPPEREREVDVQPLTAAK